MPQIHFTVNYQVKQKRKFADFLNRFAKQNGLELRDLIIERYPKFPEQFQARFHIETSSSGKEEQVFEILKLAQKLAKKGSWTWRLDDKPLDSDVYFECIFNNWDHDDEPVKWALIST